MVLCAESGPVVAFAMFILALRFIAARGAAKESRDID
jgi:hypothetical protein